MAKKLARVQEAMCKAKSAATLNFIIVGNLFPEELSA